MDEDNLPGRRLPTVVFQRELGPSGVRRIVMPSRSRRGNNWTLVSNNTLDEPGRFQRALIFNYPFNLIVPTAADGYSDSMVSILNDFTEILENTLNNYDVGYFRVYIMRTQHALTLVRNNPTSTWFNFLYFEPRHLIRKLADALISFMYEYESMFDDRTMQGIMIRVDIEVLDSSGRGTQGPLPSTLRMCSQFLWSPAGAKDCFVKCMRKLTGKSLPELKPQFIDADSMSYVHLLTLAGSLFPDYLFKLYSDSGILRFKSGDYSPGKTMCNMVLGDNHWIVITDLNNFILKTSGREFHCEKCDWQSYTPDPEHICTDIACDKCSMKFTVTGQKETHMSMDFNLMDTDKHCKYCKRRNFHNPACLSHHSTICTARASYEKELLRVKQYDQLPYAKENNKRKYIENREAILKKLAQDRRDTIKCLDCGKRYPRSDASNHVHFMERVKAREPSYKQWYAFDYESMFLPSDDGSDKNIHKVNLVCVQQLYERPEKRWNFPDISAFLKWIREEIVPQKVKTGFIAHNLKGYDGRLTLSQIFTDQVEQVADCYASDMIWTMAKVNTFQYCEYVVFRDSLLHIPMPLAAWPSTFGLGGDTVEISKGFFPYIFNTPENQNYVGPMPSIEMYQPNLMTTSARKKFIAWYDENKNNIYNFKEELLKYCEADVDILAKGLEVYNDAGVSLNGDFFQPLERLTIASYTVNIWKTLYLPENTIAVNPELIDVYARRALRGGRTDVRVFYRKYSMEDVFNRKRYMKYVDVQSMYPYVMYAFDYPVGKPTLLFEQQLAQPVDFSTYLGFASVDIEPPQAYVHHPVLVHCYNNKLCGTLKKWVNTAFTTTEIVDAIEQGWRVTRVYWMITYDGRSNALFREYIRKLISVKIHSSKPPRTANMDLLKQRWRDEFEIDVKPDECEFNAGKRSVAKLSVNSLWGKLAERHNTSFSRNVDAQEYVEYENRELHGAIELKNRYKNGLNNWLITGEETEFEPGIGENIRRKNSFLKHRKNTCVEIGAYVTMYGRRMLWQEMNKLGERVIYHDTDSIIYEYDSQAQYNVAEGELLGEWEVEHDGNPIVEFVALAPKTYAYRYLDLKAKRAINEPGLDLSQYNGMYEVYDGYVYPVREECKCKGFKLHHDARSSINFEGLLDLYRKRKVSLQADQLVFDYDREKNQITTSINKKKLKFQYEKGIICRDDCSRPFGTEAYSNMQQYLFLPPT